MERFKTYYRKLNEVSNYNGLLQYVVDDFRKGIENIFPNGIYKVDLSYMNNPKLKDITIVLNDKLDTGSVNIDPKNLNNYNDGHYTIYVATGHSNNYVAATGTVAHELTHISQQISGFLNYEHGKRNDYVQNAEVHSTFETEHDAALAELLILLQFAGMDKYGEWQKMDAETECIVQVTVHPDYYMRFPFRYMVKQMSKMNIDPKLFLKFRTGLATNMWNKLNKMKDKKSDSKNLNDIGKVLKLLKIWNYDTAGLEEQYESIRHIV